MSDALLTLNAGSSSVKFALFETDPFRAVSRGHVEGIGSAPHFLARSADGEVLAERRWTDVAPSFDALLDTLLDWTESHLGGDRLAAIGHRVVHGGADHAAPVRITASLLKSLDALTPLAPLHQPHNLAPMRRLLATRPNLPQVACFDTAFHHTMSATATRLALPRALGDAGLRRYGFHGLSYEYVGGLLRDIAPDLASGRVIVAHLGNGASLCAMQDGRSIDTTMGLTALDGLVMGTRCGTLDPGVVLYLQEARGMAAAEVQDLLYNRSGLLGVSGVASDMRDLVKSAAVEAREAVDLFIFRLAREAGGMAASLGGVDAFVFTAGIGEHAAEIRAAACARLAWLGVTLDEAANAKAAVRISTPDSRVAVLVIPTDEELMIARHTLATI